MYKIEPGMAVEFILRDCEFWISLVGLIGVGRIRLEKSVGSIGSRSHLLGQCLRPLLEDVGTDLVHRTSLISERDANLSS